MNDQMRSFRQHITESDTMNRGRIYCDMDGVLADLLAGIAEIDNLTPQQVAKFRKDNNAFDVYLTSRKKHYDEHNPHLFLNLPWMRDGKRLWTYIGKYDPWILSAHTRNWQPNCKADKIRWIHKHLKPRPSKTHLVLRAEKKDHAVTNGTPNILIDDYPQNIQQWKAEGGIGILHVSASRTIAQLKKLGYV
jgi:5'(3')-deoxyribonucleotidase